MGKPEIISADLFLQEVEKVKELKNFVGQNSDLTGSWKHTGKINTFGVEYEAESDNRVVTLSATFFKRTKGMPEDRIPEMIELKSDIDRNQYTAQSYLGWVDGEKNGQKVLGAKSRLDALDDSKDNSEELKSIFADLKASGLLPEGYREYKKVHTCLRDS